MTLLDVQDLTAAFRRAGRWTTVVDRLSFQVAAGETLAIVGESGSGKSVTALAIMRLLPERTARVAGVARLNGRDLLALPERHMEDVRGREIAMIFQEPMTSLNPVLTVGRQIGEAIIRHERVSRVQARTRTLALLDRVRIPAAATRIDEYPHQLSGGMIQRVMIALALACQPKLLIADEPTTALDVTVQAEILALLRDLQRETGMGMVFITHDMGVVAEMADRTLVMRRSQSVETAPTAALFAAPQENYTRALLAAVPRLGAMAGQDGPATFPLVDPDTGAVTASRAAAAPSLGEPVMSVTGLTARFDLRKGVFGRVTQRVHAVEDVSFAVSPGETLALVGESGCGKSTTGRCILRLVDPVAGAITVAGQDMLALRGEALRRHRAAVQMVFQDPFASLNPRLRVGDALVEPLLALNRMPRDTARARVDDLLVRVGLDPAMGARFPHEFSGGQRQRIAIARALALEPRVVVADESVSALDVSVKAQVVNLLLELQRDLGIALLFISHDMAVVERVSHRVAVMQAGQIVEIGPRQAIFGSPAHPYTRRLLAAVLTGDPARRHDRVPPPGRDIKSPIRPVGWMPPQQRWHDLADGHRVLDGDAGA